MSITLEYKILSFQKSNPDDEFCKECQNFADALTIDYFWQNEEFCLQSVVADLGLSCLTGCTNVGENISDEWYIVNVLFEISKRFSDVIIQVNDDDGEFLLIESAEYLPAWLKPSSSQNRVFISNGEVHVIPFPSTPAQVTIFPTHTPSYLKALQLIVGSHSTKAANNIQEAVHNRIKCYPGKIYEDFHHVHCYIPDSIIYILYKKPKLVAKAVEAFYERDHLDVKACKNMKTFDPGSRRTALVKFTRHLYSQISQANFFPDRTSGWRLPPSQDKNYKAAIIGFKLTCGFEILLSRGSEIADDEANQEPSGRLWEQFLEQLKKRDFFQDELEGSKRYKELLIQAKLHYKEQVLPKKGESSSVTSTVRSLINEADTHKEKIQQLCSNLPPEDDDGWLTVTPDEMDHMMKNLWKTGSSPQTEVQNMTNLIGNMKQFVNNLSSYEGAEVPEDNTATHEQFTKTDIDFDPDQFMKTVQKLLEPPSDSHPNVDEDDEAPTSDSDDEECEGEEDIVVTEAMHQMDGELRTTSIPKSFHTNQEEELDVDINLVKNFLESFASQDGLSGPVSSILQSIGMTLPPDSDR